MSADGQPPKPPRRGARNGEVGYGKPPIETRFKPGQSGNPKGRPRKTPYDVWMSRHATVHDIVRQIANEDVTIVQKGKKSTVRYIEGYLRNLAIAGMKNAGLAKLFLALVSGSEKSSPPAILYDLSLLKLTEVEELQRLLVKATPEELKKRR